MADPKTRLVVDDLSAGRNGADAPIRLKATECGNAVNIDWFRTAFARKRDGSTQIGMTSSGFTGIVSFLGRHVPGTDETAAELWGLDDAATPVFARLTGGTTWAAVATHTSSHDPQKGAALPWDVTGVSFNGKYFLSYNSLVDRLHVWDPVAAKIRPTGINAPTTAPTVANTGGGAYAAVLRYYRVRYASPGITSEATTSVSFTPSGGGTAARVTLPAATLTNEYVTHWIIEGSLDNVTFYNLSGFVAIGTTTYDDSLATGSYSAHDLSPLTGSCTTQRSYRFIAADSNRLLGFGSWETGRQNRIEISAVLGSAVNLGDDERVDTTQQYYYDLDENDSGVPTGLVGPMFGNYYAFKSRQIWQLSPTGSTASPYVLTAISKTIGCIQGHAAKIGEDAQGNPCIYFMSHRGLYRYGASGLELLSRGIEDLLQGPTSTLNMAATNVVSHLTYYPDRWQLWCWYATGASNDPDALSVLDVKTGGWTRFTGPVATARCSVAFSSTIAAAMSFRLVPYFGSTAANNRVIKGVDPAVTTDSSNPFQAGVRLRPFDPGGPGYLGQVGDALLVAAAASGVTISVTVTPDFGATPAVVGTALLTAAGSETLVSVRVAETALSGAQYVEYTIGDSGAIANAWTLHRFVVPGSRQDAVTT